MCPANRAALMRDTMRFGYIASAIFDLRSQFELKSLSGYRTTMPWCSRRSTTCSKARRASNRCSKDSQALGGHAIDCLETGEIERVRDLLNANAVI